MHHSSVRQPLCPRRKKLQRVGTVVSASREPVNLLTTPSTLRTTPGQQPTWSRTIHIILSSPFSPRIEDEIAWNYVSPDSRTVSAPLLLDSWTNQMLRMKFPISRYTSLWHLHFFYVHFPWCCRTVFRTWCAHVWCDLPNHKTIK